MRLRLLSNLFLRPRQNSFPGSEEFEKIINYRFRNLELLKIALSHRSYVHSLKLDHITLSNERLEFLGDAVLDLVIAEHFYQKFPHRKEGELSKLKSLVVSSRVLARCGKAWNLGKYILLSHSEKKAGGSMRTSIIADAFEAVLGAVYLDGGLDSARRLIQASVVNRVDEVISDRDLHNFKSELLEFLQSSGLPAPVYDLVEESGPEHLKKFKVAVLVNRESQGEGEGMSKKDAEQAAARSALHALKSRQAEAE